MAIPHTGPEHQLREWAPLTDLFTKLPAKNQSGLFYQDVKLTCVDIISEFIALGTNVGIVYWFDRNKKEMQRLRCENNIAITSLKIISTVDYMVACGNSMGNINIFQIPKSHPDNIPDSLRPKNKQVERYTVSELHKSSITALDWAKNGMKLFSGDKNGCVVLTEIDFYMHICKSVEILNEAYEVIQLSYNQQRLLVSTTYRSIICQKTVKWKVTQVGTKDRKVLGKFGGLIYQHSERPSDTCLYCTRPGLRIWIADVDGNVQKTLLFKDLLTKECPEVQLINPISINLRKLKPQKEPAFGILLPFNEKLLVTYNNGVVYILDPKEMSILSTVSNLRGVLHVATYKDEIFILEEDRSLIRLAYKPESNYANISSSVNHSFLPLSTLKDLTSKLQTANVIPAIPPILENPLNQDLNIHTDNSLVMNAEEAKESPTNLYDVQKRFDEIGKKDFEHNILFKQSKRRKKRTSLDTSTLSLSSNSSEERDLNYTRPTIMNLSAVGVLPDLRSPESIKYDIEYKEKILADVLNLDKVKLSNPIDIEEQNKSGSECDYSTSINEGMKVLSTETSKEPKIDDLMKSNSSGEVLEDDLSKSNVVKITDDPPAFKSIPNTWRLSNIRVKERSVSVKSDESLSDWEIV